jgi:hypothetical protein
MVESDPRAQGRAGATFHCTISNMWGVQERSLSLRSSAQGRVERLAESSAAGMTLSMFIYGFSHSLYAGMTPRVVFLS